MNISDVLKEQIEWFPLVTNKRIYVCEGHSAKDCFLIMNDFPDEPLWTLFYRGEFLNIDDEPKQWKIAYRSQLNNEQKAEQERQTETT